MGSYENRGASYIELGYYYDAIDDFTSAIKLDSPNIAITYINRGVVKKNLGLDFCSDFRSASDIGMCTYYNDYCK